jgi:putative ATP-dependent endonuclease of the OLD family
MIIEKVNISNYKCFKGKFSIDFNKGVNILVGDNESGKSTILEAIHLALTGIQNGRYIKNELSQYLFNIDVANDYVGDVINKKNPIPPEITIEVFFGDIDFPLFEGNGNSERINKCGIVYKIEFDPDYQREYQELIKDPQKVTTIPIEYYRISWNSCAREAVTSRSIPIKSVLIDSSSIKYQNGSDIYISRIINNNLEENERVKLTQAYRKMKEAFMAEAAVQAINQKINSVPNVSNKDLTVSVDLSPQNSWETTLMTYLDKIPFHQIGKGEQCIIKTNLALGHKKSKEAHIILLEEPENHLSHTKLNELIKDIAINCIDKQIIISTHSSFVANKLGLENLILLNNQKISRLSNLSKETYTFFKKLAGYQTLRLILCKKTILVEGDSDELIFQKAYKESHVNHLPIENGIDVISVGLTFLRFLEVADKIDQPVAVITDNDKDFKKKIQEKYQYYEKHNFIKIFADNRNELKTLEPQFVDANLSNLKNLCDVLGIDSTKFTTPDQIIEYMSANKTTWALNVFESTNHIEYPEYIKKAIEWCDEK